MAAVVAIGSLKMRSHWLNTRLLVAHNTEIGSEGLKKSTRSDGVRSGIVLANRLLQATSDQDRTPFIALGDERKQHLGLFGVLFEIADVIEDQQLEIIYFRRRRGRPRSRSRRAAPGVCNALKMIHFGVNPSDWTGIRP